MNNTTVCLYPGREGCKLKGQAEEVIQIPALQVEDVTEKITLHLPFFLATTPSPEVLTRDRTRDIGVMGPELFQPVPPCPVRHPCASTEAMLRPC